MLGALVALLALPAFGCASEVQRVAQLEERVQALEAEVGELRSADPEPANASETTLDLSRAAGSPVSEAPKDPEVVASATIVDEIMEDGTPLDLTSTLLAGFADVADVGEMNEEFGGITIEGDAASTSIVMFRNGLVHEERIRELLVAIGFAEAAVEGLATGEAATAQSDDGRLTVTSQPGEDELRIVIELLP